MELWNKMWNVWQELEVPNVQIRKFIIGEHYSNSPWFSIIKDRQLSFTENPLNDTAYHLNVVLKNSNEELIAAYKIFAFLKYNGYDSNWSDPLVYVMKKNDHALYGWWNANSRYVMPYIEQEPRYNFDPRSGTKDWENLVRSSAKYWIAIAKEWEIIEIPDHMDYESEELKKFEEYLNKLYEDQEYKKYLRLKNKYENL